MSDQSVNIVITPQEVSVSANPQNARTSTGNPVARQAIYPYIKVEGIEDGAVVTCTDPDGTTTATIYNGEKGDQGDPGSPGSPGKDGTDGKDGSPGKDGKDGIDGKDGENGSDGFSPTVTIETITGGHSVSVTDVNGTQTFSVMDGAQGEQGAPGIGLPPVTSSDNGKVARVVDGAWAAVQLPSATGVSF